MYAGMWFAAVVMFAVIMFAAYYVCAQKHITSKRLNSPYTSGTKLGFISRPIKSADAFLPKYGIKNLFENSVRPLEKKPSKSYKNENLSYNPCRESVV